MIFHVRGIGVGVRHNLAIGVNRSDSYACGSSQ